MSHSHFLRHAPRLPGGARARPLDLAPLLRKASWVGRSPSAFEVGRRLGALPETEMRRQVLGQWLASLADEDIVALMSELAQRGREHADLEVAALALAQVLEHEDLGYERVAVLYRVARRRGDELAARLLLTGGRQPGSSRPQYGELMSEPSMPLGWRKTHARGSRRDMIDRLLHDPDPSVLTILLQNPRVVERDAVFLAARRPTTAPAQRAVFTSRHGRSHAVRLALVMNPYTPVDLAARLLPGLPGHEIEEVAQAEGLAMSLRQTASALLRARAGQAAPIELADEDDSF